MPRPTTARLTCLAASVALLLGACSPSGPAAGEDARATSSEAAGSPSGPDSDRGADDQSAEGRSRPVPSQSPGVAATTPDEQLAQPCQQMTSGIEVVSPQPGDTVRPGDAVEGCGVVFEGTVLWEVTFADPLQQTSGFTTASCGNGCVSVFRFPLEVDQTGDAEIVVYEFDEATGMRANVQMVPVTVSD